MTKLANILTYYILVLIGLIGTSWIIWARFIRERTIRNIPDELLTEYRVWILAYICCVYIYIVKNLIKEKKSNIILGIISSYIGKPLMLFDHFIKYNRFCKGYYQQFMMHVIKFVHNLSIIQSRSFIFSFQIIPRIILVTVLIMDTFYFNFVEIFYKIVLIGLLPFLFKYLMNSFTDFYDHLVSQLTDKYDTVLIFEKGYHGDLDRKGKTKAVWHFEWVSVEEYIEIIYDTPFEDTPYEYVGDAFCKQEVYEIYKEQFKKPDVSDWTREEHEKVTQLFEELIPKILKLKLIMSVFEILKKEKAIIRTQIVIFSLYLLCWSYILVISYYNNPVELVMLKYLIVNLMTYLIMDVNPFMENIYSININLVTIQNIKNLIINILNNIINNILK